MLLYNRDTVSIESDCREYIDEMAHELAGEILASLKEAAQ